MAVPSDTNVEPLPTSVDEKAKAKAEEGKGKGSKEQTDTRTTAFSLRMSKALQRKVEQKATDEGITPEELACELIAEGLVLRAWEIMERKSAMRGASGGYSPKGGGRYQQKTRRGFSKGGRGEKHSNVLEDRAAFMEYVRNQEKGRK